MWHPCSENIRRTASGAVDTDHYMRAARRLRGKVISAWLHNLVGGVWRHRRDADVRGRLMQCADRELHDMALCRCEIEAVANGSYFADASRRQRGGCVAGSP
jgi:uncharacterized protein YjiS (DUF1127 family)